jgi:hypothetical protein
MVALVRPRAVIRGPGGVPAACATPSPGAILSRRVTRSRAVTPWPGPILATGSIPRRGLTSFCRGTATLLGSRALPRIATLPRTPGRGRGPTALPARTPTGIWADGIPDPRIATVSRPGTGSGTVTGGRVPTAPHPPPLPPSLAAVHRVTGRAMPAPRAASAASPMPTASLHRRAAGITARSGGGRRQTPAGQRDHPPFPATAAARITRRSRADGIPVRSPAGPSAVRRAGTTAEPTITRGGRSAGKRGKTTQASLPNGTTRRPETGSFRGSGTGGTPGEAGAAGPGAAPAACWPR